MTPQEARMVLEQSDLLVPQDEVLSVIARLAGELSDELQDENPVMICCMNGGLIFAGQILPQLVFPLEVDYVHATRYGRALQGALLDWHVKPRTELTDRVVVLLDDILDEGVTLAAVADYCRQQGARKVLMAVLVEKLHLRKVTPGMKADFTGIEIGDRFVFGYGLDYKGYWRNAPGIYALRES